MEKIAVSVLGTDRPGIVAAVSKILLEHQCNIEDVSQTSLQTEFAGIFITTVPEKVKSENLLSSLQKGLEPFGAYVLLKPIEGTGAGFSPSASEPFVVTTVGADRLGLVAGVTEVMARFGVNISNLRAVFRGGDDPSKNTMIYEVDIPDDIDTRSFRQALQDRAVELGLDLSIQHRDVFEAINRV